MTNKDREAFEQVAGAYFPHGPIHPALYRKNDGKYFHTKVSHAWNFWQAARDHYAPKLSEKEAVECAATEIAKAAWVERYHHLQGADLGFVVANADDRELAKKSLRAAGVRFKEEE